MKDAHLLQSSLGRSGRIILTVLAGLGMAGPLSVPVTAQVETLLRERTLEYQAARSAFEAARDARAAAEVRFTTASLEVDNARASGDDARLRRALAAAQAQAGELERLDRRVQQVGEELEAARQALLSALDDRLAVLYAELEAASSLEGRRQIGDLIRDLQTQVTEVESGVDFASQIQLVAMPEVQFDPRDGPEELRLKAQIAESWVDRYDSQLELIDETIEELRERQRRERDFEQFMAGIRRFDDATVPVVAPPPSNPQPDPAQAGVPDSTAAPGDGVEVSLEDQIGQLLILRSQVENYREQVRIRARVFRRRLGGVTG